MSSLPLRPPLKRNDYPTSDGKPMAETDYHRDLMIDLIATLRTYYAQEPLVYVSGNLLVLYDKEDGRKHVSPDVFVVQGVAKQVRENYLIWEEEHAPSFVIELTSKSTKKEDQNKKKKLYQDVLKVREYFLFDPKQEYLQPSLQGWRLHKGVYQSIAAIENRFPSEVTGLHLQRAGTVLRLWNPQTQAWLLTEQEAKAVEIKARQEAERAQHEEARARQEAERAQHEESRARQEAERAQHEEARARQEAERAQHEEARARQEAERKQQQAEQQAAEALAEVQRLRQMLGLQRPSTDPM